MKKIFPSKFLKAICNGIAEIVRYLYQGMRHGLGKAYFRRSATLFLSYMNHISNAMREESINKESLQKLRQTTRGLHALLPKDSRFTYSILVPIIESVSVVFLKNALKAALDQTAPDMEVLVGFSVQPSAEIKHLLEEFKKESPQKFQYHYFPNPSLLNQLVDIATGNFLLLMNPCDWIRPDLLFRYEQTMRLLPDPENTVFYCNEYQINDKDHPIPFSHIRKPEHPHFPFLFSDDVRRGLLIPKALWNKVGGISSNYNDQQTFDLILRLDIAKAFFLNIPFYLYAARSSTKEYNAIADKRALMDYAKARQLDWQITEGYLLGTYRAIPKLKKSPSIHVIVPFKDQKDLTLRAVKCALEQSEVNVKVTAVDNGSHDNTIRQELQALGVEVLVIDEPFNYSRLNNLAVKQTQIGKECELLLFLNNDVDLDREALLEMCRWIHQPSVGMVGCRLHYPDGTLQHGGVELYSHGPIHRMTWEHVERFRPFEKMQCTKKIRVTKAVTAACALVKRSVFCEIGGFDEVWYPIAYSDTNLAVKLAQKGLWCLYTPYAFGVHHESVSRKNHHIEDFENSAWLQELFLKRMQDTLA